MQISELQLRQLVSSLLIEGPEQDRQSLIAKYPDSEDKLKSLPVKFVSWLQDRFGDDARQEEVHPFEDAIVTVVNFAKADASIGAKWKSNEQFKKSIEEEFPKRRWAAPTDIKTMTADEMETIIGLSQRKKQRFDVKKEDSSFEDDKIGKVGPWNLWMPTTRENSCKIAQYDPVTMQPKTTWCTARTSGSNLFYNYIGSSGYDITLFYIIKDDPKDSNDWLSLGFLNGKPVLDGKNGGFSVNKNNEGLTRESLQAALGSNFDQIINVLTQKNNQLGGKHPTAKKVEEATKSVEAYEELVRGLSDQEKTELTLNMLKNYKKSVSQDLLAKLSDSKNTDIKHAVASNTNLSLETILKLANHDDPYVRYDIVYNSSTPSEVLAKMADDDVDFVREAVARNKSTPIDTLTKLAKDKELRVRLKLLDNPSITAKLLTLLSKDRSIEMKRKVAQNELTPSEALMRLANDKDLSTRMLAAGNPSLSQDFLAKLANSDDYKIRINVAQNTSASQELLNTLMKDVDPGVRWNAKENLKKRGLQESLLRRIIRDVYNTL